MQDAVFGLSSIVTGYRCVSELRMNNEISDNNQKIVLKLRVNSATIELVKNLQVCTMVDFVEVYYFLINSEELYD